jgi:hypothetical protein
MTNLFEHHLHRMSHDVPFTVLSKGNHYCFEFEKPVLWRGALKAKKILVPNGQKAGRGKHTWSETEILKQLVIMGFMLHNQDLFAEICVAIKKDWDSESQRNNEAIGCTRKELGK